MVAFLFLRRRASLYHPAVYYLAFHGFVFVIRPLVNKFYNFEFVYKLYGFFPNEQERALSLLASDIGLLSFTVPCLWIASSRFIPKPSSSEPFDHQRRARPAFLAAAAISLPLALYSQYVELTQKVADVSTTTFDSSTGVTVNTTGNGYLHDASNMLVSIVVIFAWQYRFKLWALVPFCLYAFARLAVGTSRWTFVMASASLALLYLYEHRRTLPSPKVIVGATAILVAFTIAGSQRSYFRDQITGARSEVVNYSGPTKPLEGMDYANQEYLEFLVWAIPNKTNTYDYFINNLQVVTEPIPRLLWKDKPVGAPIKMFSLWDYGKPVGMTYSLPGVGWMSLGLVGVVIWCGLFGILFGHIYQRFARSKQSGFQVCTYALLVPLSIQFFRDGTLLTLLKFPLFYLVPLALWKMFAKLGLNSKQARKPFRASNATFLGR